MHPVWALFASDETVLYRAKCLVHLNLIVGAGSGFLRSEIEICPSPEIFLRCQRLSLSFSACRGTCLFWPGRWNLSDSVTMQGTNYGLYITLQWDYIQDLISDRSIVPEAAVSCLRTKVVLWKILFLKPIVVLLICKIKIGTIREPWDTAVAKNLIRQIRYIYSFWTLIMMIKILVLVTMGKILTLREVNKKNILAIVRLCKEWWQCINKSNWIPG